MPRLEARKKSVKSRVFENVGNWISQLPIKEKETKTKTVSFDFTEKAKNNG
jgi:hypothetical protein